MRFLRPTLGFCLLLLLLAPLGGADGLPVVAQTTEGPVVGRINGSEPGHHCFGGPPSFPGLPDVAAFFGVPYAAAPVGKLRWRPPRPAAKRAAAFDATKPGAVCPQAPFDQLAEVLPEWTPGWSFEEDCLKLNIWSPSLRANGTVSRLEPVMVWIHGGGFAGGNGYTQAGCPFYNGMPIAANENIVVVSLNYRLGSLGFLDLPELREESGTAGNYGLQDQRLALKWVQRNIAAFGGDPRRVTIMGESAGGSSVLYHSVLKRSAGLFSQVIAQSGYDLTKQQHGHGPMSAPQYGRSLQASLRCGGGRAWRRNEREQLLDCLRNATARDVLSAQDKYLKARSIVDTELTFAPVADGYEMPVGSSLVDEMHKRPPRVPMIIGSNLNETSLFLCYGLKEGVSEQDAASYSSGLAMKLGINLTAPETNHIMSLYPVGSNGGYTSHRSAVISATTDMWIGCPTKSIADIVGAVPGARVYRYLLARSPWFFRAVSSCLGVPHVADTMYTFLSGGLPGPLTRALFDADDKVLVDVMNSAFWSFVRSGAPTLPAGTAAGSWPRYDRRSGAILRLDATPTVERGFHTSECAAMPRTGRDSPPAADEGLSFQYV